MAPAEKSDKDFKKIPNKNPEKKLKRKKKKKIKDKEKANVVPIGPKVVEADWWDTFWHKYSSAPGSTAPRDEEDGFRHFFRMSKQTFQYICYLVREDLISRPPSGLINIEGRLISVEKQVAIAIRRLASGESQVSVGSSFGVGQSTVSQVTWRFIEAMEARARHHLMWPDERDRMKSIKSGFEALCGLPNCCGAIDTTHIVMTLPAVETSDDWLDGARNCSMLLQGIVDHDLRFLDVVTGWPGRMDVPTLLEFTGFFKLCENGDRLNGEARTVLVNGREDSLREYVVGGKSYPLLSWLMTPFEEDGLGLSEYKESHEAARSLAATAFAQLKGNWRILSKVMWRPDKHKLPSIILVCCLLHNVMIDCGDKLCEEIALPHHDVASYGEMSCKRVDQTGRRLRECLSSYLQNVVVRR